MSRPHGAAILDDVATFIRRFVVFPSEHAFTAVTLWAAHTHAIASFYVSPRLILDSAEPGSGKTRVLELLALLVHNPEMTISATVAAIFRMLDDEPYTLLFDEVDAIFSPKAAGNNEDLRALLNAGYKRGATTARCVGDAKSMKVKRFTVFAPVALAGLAGRMPSTITTRAVTIHMRRRAPGEHVEPFRERDAELDAFPLRDSLQAWMSSQAVDLEHARPAMPTGVADRPAEVWEALLAVADAAGGDWPASARAACEHYVLKAKGEPESLGVRLLADVLQAFTIRQADRMASAELVAALVAVPESPWADLYGKQLDQRRLAKELARYGVESKPVRIGDATPRGYRSDGEEGLIQAWERYLPDYRATSATGATDLFSDVADTGGVAFTNATDPLPATPDDALTSNVSDVADVAPKPRATWRISGESA